MNNLEMNVTDLYLTSTSGEEMNPITQIKFNDKEKLVSLIEVSFGDEVEVYKPRNYEEFKKELIQKIDEVNKNCEIYRETNDKVWDYIEKINDTINSQTEEDTIPEDQLNTKENIEALKDFIDDIIIEDDIDLWALPGYEQDGALVGKLEIVIFSGIPDECKYVDLIANDKNQISMEIYNTKFSYKNISEFNYQVEQATTVLNKIANSKRFENYIWNGKN